MGDTLCGGCVGKLPAMVVYREQLFCMGKHRYRKVKYCQVDQVQHYMHFVKHQNATKCDDPNCLG